MSDDLFKVNPQAEAITKEECQKLYKDIVDKVNEVYHIFIDFYGEENVDLQGIRSEELYLENLNNFHKRFIENSPHTCYSNEISEHAASLFYGDYDCAEIYVRWPECIIENEYGKKHLIKDLFAKILVTYDGKMYNNFTLSRTTYSMAEWKSDYAHSHLCGIPIKNDEDDYFESPCLGSGPIRNTIATLIHEFNAEFWRLFCLELDLYAHTESISGTPYRYISSIGREGSNSDIVYFARYETTTYKENGNYIQDLNLQKWLNLFIIYMLKKDIPYIRPTGFSDKGGYFINFCAYTDVVKMSSEFLKFAKENHLIIQNYMNEGLYNSQHNGIVLYSKDEEENIDSINGKEVFCFKGNPVFVSIKLDDDETKPFKVLKFNIIQYILFAVNNIYNCNLKFQYYGGKTNIVGEKPYRFL